MSFPSHSSPGSSKDPLFAARAQQLLTQGEIRTAMEICRRGLIFFPDNPAGYVVLANAYLASGDGERARRVVEDGVRRTGSLQLRGLLDGTWQTRLREAAASHRPEAPIAPLVEEPDALSPIEEGEHPVEKKTATSDPPAVEEDASLDKPSEVVGGPQPAAADIAPLISVGADEESGAVVADVGEGSAPAISPVPGPRPLALHVAQPSGRPRSANLRLIPGLEFAPLRHEEPAQRQTIAPIMSEPMPEPEPPRGRGESGPPPAANLPPLPGAVEEMRRETLRAVGVEMRAAPRPSTDPQPLPASSLSEAIDGLRGAGLRLGAFDESEADEPAQQTKLTPLEELARRLENARIPVVEESEQRTPFEPSIVSDTLAQILVQQGAFTEALKAFQMLARMKPERIGYYQERIREMKRLIDEGR